MNKIFSFDEGYAPGGHGAVWIEENLSLWPLFKMRATGGRPGPDEVETHTVKLLSIDAEGNKVEASLTLRGSAGVGLPWHWDQDTLFAVEELLQERDGPDEDGGLDFSLRKLVSIAGHADTGQYYERMRASLDRIGSTWIISDKAFYNPRTETLISDRFNLWTVRFRDDRDLYSRHLREQHRLQFHKNFIDAYQNGYGRYLDRDFYWSLHYPTSKRLYRLLSSQFAYQKEWQVDPFTLRDLMLIGGYQHVSRIQQAMRNAYEELKSRGFLRSVEDRKLADGKKVLVFKSSKKYATRMREQRVLDDPEKQVAYLILKEHGVWRSSRLSLIEEHGASKCIEASEAMARQRKVRNPGAWLSDALRNGYDLEGPEDVEENESSLPEAGAGSVNEGSAGAGGAEEDADITRLENEDQDGAAGSGVTGLEQDELRLARGGVLDTSRPHYDGSDGKADKVWCSLVEEYAFDRDTEATSAWLLKFVGYRLDDSARLVVVAPDQSFAQELIDGCGWEITRLWKKRRGDVARIVVGDYEQVLAGLENAGDDAG